jgi:acyl-CoA synthetase (AMP-forming)/AMP-acid ligase II
MVLARGGPPPPADRHRLRFALCGSAPVPVELIHRFQERTGVPVIEGYGLTECTCRATFNPVASPRPGSVGLPIGNELRIAGDDGAERAPGEVGEILLRGGNVMAGYLRAPEATRHALRGGWLHTGDLGRRTEDGFVYVVGRQSDMIIRGGENIYPREIEDVLYALPGLEEAAVIGVPDALYGEVVVACVAQDPARRLTPERILAHCREHLAPFKIPTSVHLLDRLPRNATGKFDKGALRARLHSESERSLG